MINPSIHHLIFFQEVPCGNNKSTNPKKIYMSFKEENRQDWIDIQKKIFPTGLPTKCEWTNIAEIVYVLKIIGSLKNVNHMFFPRGGGFDLLDANLSSEKGCIEILTGGMIQIVKPSKLIFHSFQNADPQWNYFRIEADTLTPSGVYENYDFPDEYLCEISNGTYIDRKYWDDGEYEGNKLSSKARLVSRHFRGAFVIFQKTSTYNGNSSTYDGRHNKMSDDEFKKYIQTILQDVQNSYWID
jgi:serine/threonine-protein kinase